MREVAIWIFTATATSPICWVANVASDMSERVCGHGWALPSKGMLKQTATCTMTPGAPHLATLSWIVGDPSRKSKEFRLFGEKKNTPTSSQYHLDVHPTCWVVYNPYSYNITTYISPAIKTLGICHSSNCWLTQKKKPAAWLLCSALLPACAVTRAGPTSVWPCFAAPQALWVPHRDPWDGWRV